MVKETLKKLAENQILKVFNYTIIKPNTRKNAKKLDLK